jgi:hypothetical protein
VQPRTCESGSGATSGWRVGFVPASAIVTSIVMFALMYANGVRAARCATDACVAGATLYWVLAARWTPKVRHETTLVRWAAAYALAAMLVLLASAAVTAWTQAHVRAVPGHGGFRIILVTGSYALVLAALAGIRFVWSRRSTRTKWT